MVGTLRSPFMNTRTMVGMLTAALALTTGVSLAQSDEPAHASHRPMHEPVTPRHVPAIQPGDAHGHHGDMPAGLEHFPTLAYDDRRAPRPAERRAMPQRHGDPAKGRELAYASDKGGCISCHALDSADDQPGDVGPNLSDYGKRGYGDDYTFQQVWDGRAHNPYTTMPPFGTNEILSLDEATDIVAYLKTLKSLASLPTRDPGEQKDYLMAGIDFTVADEYLERGERLFRQPGHNSRACATCHGAHSRNAHSLKGAAASYPKLDTRTRQAVSLEERINLCRVRNMDSRPFALGSAESNTLTGYVKSLSRGIPVRVSMQGPEAEAVKRGEKTFFRKAGRLNLACADCHVSYGGQWLRGQRMKAFRTDSADAGVAAKFPTYHIGRHELGFISLQQRIEHCQVITQTAPLALGSREYTELELYLTALAKGRPLVAPTADTYLGEPAE